MDASLLEAIQANPTLKAMLTKPNIRRLLDELHEGEARFEARSARDSNFITPLEQRILVGHDSEEQQFLRLLLEVIAEHRAKKKN